MDITLNRTIRKYTAFQDIFELVAAKGSYRPSMETKGCSTSHRAMTRLANKYDRIMIAIGDPRRAYRY